jgi:CheY-like chemotaxis protein
MKGEGDTTMTESGGSALVIEDDPDIRALLVSRLQRLGFRVRTAESGEIGMREALAEPPNLIMLDILLPGIDGWEVARRLRGDPRTAQVPLVIASIVEPGAESEPFAADGYLVKPFSAKQVEDVVTRVVAQDVTRRAANEEVSG